MRTKSLIFYAITCILPLIIFIFLLSIVPALADIEKMVKDGKWGEMFNKYKWMVLLAVITAGIAIIFLPIINIVGVIWIIFLVINFILIGLFIIGNILRIRIPIITTLLVILESIILIIFGAIIPIFFFSKANKYYKLNIKEHNIAKKINKQK